MGQPVSVVEKPSVARPGVVRYETNRPLSGMGHRRYLPDHGWFDPLDPADELARRLFERGGVDAVHVNGSVITVDLTKGHSAAGIAELIRHLFIHYET